VASGSGRQLGSDTTPGSTSSSPSKKRSTSEPAHCVLPEPPRRGPPLLLGFGLGALLSWRDRAS